jgi:hypothetical protein
MADRAGGFGRVGVMMPDASERHGEDQQHKQRYWNNHVPNWFSFGHDTTTQPLPAETTF